MIKVFFDQSKLTLQDIQSSMCMHVRLGGTYDSKSGKLMSRKEDPKIYYPDAKKHWACAKEVLKSGKKKLLLFSDNDRLSSLSKPDDLNIDGKVFITSDIFGAMVHVGDLKKSGNMTSEFRNSYLKTFLDFYLLSNCGVTLASASGFSLSAIAAGFNDHQRAYFVPRMPEHVQPKSDKECFPIPLLEP